MRDVRLIRSPLSVAGMVLTTASGVLFIIVLLADLFGLHTNPYIGILFFLLLPGVFLVGLALIPLGAWRERRRRLAGRPPVSTQWPRIDLNEPRQRTTAVIVFSLTMANIVIVSLAAYRGVGYMDSEAFCGQVCHQAMRPQFTTHGQGPHSHVACVQCHVGSGAGSYAQAKLSGVRRLISAVRDTYPRPLPSPLREPPPAGETCGRCHAPETFHGDSVKRIFEYADDEANTESVTTLTMKVGGGSDPLSGRGIHWHADPANEVDYIAADEARVVIPFVRVRDRSGTVREYVAPGVDPAEIAGRPVRRMDCFDCHNRAAHPMSASVDRLVNGLVASGAIPRTLPFARREAARALDVPYASEDEAMEGIARALGDFYRSRTASAGSGAEPDFTGAVRAVQQAYRRNVFPEMRVGLGTYPSQLGHTDAPGCFRCHDDEHKAADGRTIGQECDRCHTIE